MEDEGIVWETVGKIIKITVTTIIQMLNERTKNEVLRFLIFLSKYYKTRKIDTLFLLKEI